MTRNIDDIKSNISNMEKKYLTAKQNFVAAERTVSETRSTYEIALGKGREAAIKARQNCANAEVDLDIARRSVEDLDAQITSMRESVNMAIIEHKRSEADRLRGVFEVVAQQGLARMSTDARTILRAWCEAELAIQEARQAQGRGGLPIPDAEVSRNVSRVPDKEIKRIRSVRLIHPRTGTPYPEEIEKEIRNTRSKDELPHAAMCEAITYELGSASVHVPLLIQSLSVPAFRGGGQPGWEPSEHATPVEVLERLNKLDQAPTVKPAKYKIVETVIGK